MILEPWIGASALLSAPEPFDDTAGRSIETMSNTTVSSTTTGGTRSTSTTLSGYSSRWNAFDPSRFARSQTLEDVPEGTTDTGGSRRSGSAAGSAHMSARSQTSEDVPTTAAEPTEIIMEERQRLLDWCSAARLWATQYGWPHGGTKER